MPSWIPMPEMLALQLAQYTIECPQINMLVLAGLELHPVRKQNIRGINTY